MNAPDLIGVGPGFADPVFDSQAAFRGCLTALSTPGTIVALGAGLKSVPDLHAAASTLLLALLDQDTRLWLSPGIAAGPVAASLKFHTGCSLAAVPGEADFALIAGPEELPPLATFCAGSDEYPERSATIVLQVPALLSAGWRLTGPGIQNETRFSVPSLGDEFLAQWECNRQRFPRGVDFYISCGERLGGLPRTTRIEN